MRHPKSVRRRFLQVLYEHYMADPLEMAPPDTFIECGLDRSELVPNAHYLADSGLIELMRGYNPFSFAGVRITPRGIDLVENHHAFNLAFPPDLGEAEGAAAGIPLSMERLVEEAELSPLDGEARKSLLRDIVYLREEFARPVERWRREVIGTVIGWIEGYLAGHEECFLPSLAALKEAVEKSR